MKRFETSTKHPHERRHPLCENATLSRAEMRLSDPANSGNDLKSKWSISGMLHHLMVWLVKWNILFKKETWLSRAVLQKHTEGDLQKACNDQKCVFPWRKWEPCPRLVHIHVQEDEGSLQRLIVERTQNTSLHHWLTAYKCFSSWIHAHPAARTIAGR